MLLNIMIKYYQILKKSKLIEQLLNKSLTKLRRSLMNSIKKLIRLKLKEVSKGKKEKELKKKLIESMQSLKNRMKKLHCYSRKKINAERLISNNF